MAYLPSSFVAFSVGCTLVYLLFFRRTKTYKLPPGPKQWPLIGNLLDLPRTGSIEYQHWLQHKERYGPISSVRVMGQTIIILHDQQATRDLLDKMSKTTSSRPELEFAHNFAGFGTYPTCKNYREEFVRERKFMHQQLGTRKIVSQYGPIQEKEVGRMLLRALKEPEKLMQHFKDQAGAIILGMSYGYSVGNTKGDYLVRLVNQMMENFSKSFAPMAWLVDAVPALKYLPEWFPGAEFKQIGKEWHYVNYLTANVPYSFTRQEMRTNDYTPSVVANLVQEYGEAGADDGVDYRLPPSDEESIKWVAAALYGGGADTTVTSMSSFILAMVKFPEIQKRAREEIDTIIGPGRLPRAEDQDRLPYVQAVAKETLRWWTVVPMGVAHVVDKDIEYRDYVIPQGAMILPAIWWFLNDPQVYKDPQTFDPTRFLAPRNEPDPANFCFGFGRRICPGRLLVDSSVFLGIAQILTCFDIKNAVDENGIPIEPEVRGTPGLIQHVKPFPYSITPRSAAHRKMIEDFEDPSEVGDVSKLQGIDILEKVLKDH
jgi:cytochrome P450